MKPSMTPFSSSLPRIYQVYSYYTHTPIQDHHASDMTRLIQTLTSLTTDEIPLILPLLRRIFTDIMSDPDLHTLTHTFITLWTRIALALHEEQVSQLLLPIMMELLEGSLAMKNYDPLMGICDREVCGRIFGCVGNLQFLKNFLPVLLEQLLAPQTPRDVSDRLVGALTLISSPRFLGSALTTRYILPTLTVKTGNINYKRTVSMQEYPAGPSFSLPTRRLHLSVYDLPRSDRRRAPDAEGILAARSGASFFVDAHAEEHPGGDVCDGDRGGPAGTASLLLPSHDPLQPDRAKAALSRGHPPPSLLPDGFG